MTDQPVESREGLAVIDGQQYYVVPDLDSLAPFFMSIVSDGDRWAFASSTGALSAGRGDAVGALFPYQTDDRLHRAAGRNGPVTAVMVDGSLWRPFRDRHPSNRRLAKSVIGDVVLLEEDHPASGLSFRSRWASCEPFGFVRTATLRNDGERVQQISVLDGFVDVLPHGLDPALYQRMSNLTHAYKRSELIDPATRLAVFSLEAPVGDRAEPEEVLRATVAWSVGLDEAAVALAPDAVDAFEEGRSVPAAGLVTGRPGAYLLHAPLLLEPGESVTWHICADVGRDQADVVRLRSRLRSGDDLATEIESAIRSSSHRLEAIMASSDGLQCTGDAVAGAHHFANVTYNVMRGGVPLAGHRIPTAGLAGLIRRRDRRVADRHRSWLEALPEVIERDDLLSLARTTDDAHLIRLADEYLPLTFSRRHGDPSRPWNSFSIRVTDDDGDPVVHYEGNWRDVFQNWEALGSSFPRFLPGMISVFVDGSTADGHNPYRITSEGFEWEVPDPDDPWSNIGYWGDHQLVYLLRLVEASERFQPGEVPKLLGERRFTYADVPYRLAPYEDLLRDPKATIEYDEAAATLSEARVADVGADGKLVVDSSGEPIVVTLTEKLLVAALAKLSNYVPGGGIWMNTQRPDWNDANNALVGYGLSMVTLCQLRHFLHRLAQLVADGPDQVDVAVEVAEWFESVLSVLEQTSPSPEAAQADLHRKNMMDALGSVASDYRLRVYASGFSGQTRSVNREQVSQLCDAALGHLDHTISGAKRPDGLYDAYNLLEFAQDGESVGVARLPEMLEGQVAVLASGVLSAGEQAELAETLFTSALYRADQNSFVLYPRRVLPSFLDKNVIPGEAVALNPLLTALIAAGDTSIVQVDDDGAHRFHPDLVDEDAVEAVLGRLAVEARWADLVEDHRRDTLDLYEAVFRHRAHLGRSGSMYGYEGIGSIYWHMVTKLLLAVEEAAVGAVASGASSSTVDRLVTAYGNVRGGLGFEKTAAEFGAIPTDPYSHTPAHAGAQQPGMTGAVKEELLARPLELGVRFEDGEILFDPLLLRDGELLESSTRWSYVDVEGSAATLELEAGTVGLTVCQVPVVVGTVDGDSQIDVEFSDGRTTRRPGTHLGRDVSAMIFGRTGEVVSVRASLSV